MYRYYLLLLAFTAGFIVMAVEIALGRLLAPYFGAGAAVWAAIIACIITALSIGYPLGGILADKRPSPLLPVALLLIGGVSASLMGIATPWVMSRLEGDFILGAGNYWPALFLLLLVFCLPCAVLAMVSPAVLRMTLRGRETAGRDAGWIYALGSVGSVLGILLPALWWIPGFGLRITFSLLAVLSLSVSLFGLLRLARPLWSCLSMVALLAASIIPPGHKPADFGMRIIFDGESPVQHVRVIEGNTQEGVIRFLQLQEGGGILHSIYSSYADPVASYGVWNWLALTGLWPSPDDAYLDVLIVGIAGGTVSNLLSGPLRPHIATPRIVGVEIDPLVVEVADRYLGLDRRYLHTEIADARVFLNGDSRQYDLIILDAYRQNNTIPAHLATREFFTEVKEKLAPKGMAVLNVFAPQGSRVYRGLLATWCSVFDQVRTVNGPVNDEGLQSNLFFAGPASSARVYAPLHGHLATELNWLRDNLKAAAVDRSLSPWSDDRAPVELLSDRVYRQLQERRF